MRDNWAVGAAQLMTRSGRRGSLVCSLVLLSTLIISCSGASDDKADKGAQKPSAPATPVFEGTEDEWLLARADCLTAAGWDAEADVQLDSISVPSVTFEQRKAFKQAEAACSRSVGDLPTEPPHSAEELEKIYDYFVEELTPCLTKRGYQVEDPPSRDTFIESYYDPTAEGVWIPYDHVDPPSQEEWREIQLQCPQDPDDVR